MQCVGARQRSTGCVQFTLLSGRVFQLHWACGWHMQARRPITFQEKNIRWQAQRKVSNCVGRASAGCALLVPYLSGEGRLVAMPC